MMEIRNDRDYKLYWEILVEIIEYAKESGKYTPKRVDHIRDIKVALRKYNKERPEPRKCVYDDSYGDFTELYRLDVPDDWEYEDVKDYFEEWEVQHCIPSQYDCTGQIFTTGYKIFKRHGHWMCYHSYGMDI